MSDEINDIEDEDIPEQSPEEISAEVAMAFTGIYEEEQWKSGRSFSGSGSELEQTAHLTQMLISFIRHEKICSIVDAPCGDMHWQQQLLTNLFLSKVSSYTGIDIVPELIEECKIKEPRANYLLADIIYDKLPACDFLMIRDCLVHLPNELVLQAIRNAASSESKWIGITTFISYHPNQDIELGDWRPLNLMRAPFDLPAPKYMLMEHCTEREGRYTDKALAIWRRKDLEALNVEKVNIAESEP